MDGVCLRASAKLCGDDFLSLKHVKTTWDVFQRLSKILKLNIIKYSGFSGIRRLQFKSAKMNK